MDAPNPYQQGPFELQGRPIAFSPTWTDADAEQIADAILELIRRDWIAAREARLHFEPNLRGYVRDNISGLSDNTLTNMYQRVRRRWQNQFKKPTNRGFRVGGGPRFPPPMPSASSPGFPPQHSPIARPPPAPIQRPVNSPYRAGPSAAPAPPSSSLQQELLREESRKRKAAEDAVAMENGTAAKKQQLVSPEDALITSTDPMHPANHIPTLCHQFYGHGWVTGTGGGLSIKRDNHVFLAPSGVQKELMKPIDIFVMDYQSREYIRRPQVLKPSACTPLFMAAYTNRGAGACIHTHSQWAVLVTLICESGLQSYGDSDNVFCMRKIEQIKGISRGGTGSQEIAEGGRKLGNLGYFDTMKIPIIENTAHEEDLEESMSRAMEHWPETCAVLVRRHGVYVWGKDVAQAKTQCESLDYLFQLAVEMHKLGLKWV